jgi:membrane-bound lytic murein transglycosylase C
MKLLLIFITLSTLLFAEQSYEEYQKEQSGAYNKYKTDLEKEFADYQKAMDEEFQHYKKTLKTYWDEPQIDDPKKWTTYSKDNKTRTIVDWEKGIMKVQTQTSDVKEAVAKAKVAVAAAITVDRKTALKNDPLEQRFAKRLAKLKSLQKALPKKNSPILADVYFEDKPSKQKVDSKVKELFKTAKKGVKQTPKRKKKYVEIEIPLPKKKGAKALPAYLAKKADNFKSDAKKYAKKEGVPYPLVMAIMQSESSFNPMARSHVPAFGLMQVVPRSAGKDATRYLEGKMRMLSPSYLYNSEKNIMTGSAYLHILYYSYLKKIKNPKSRIYCTIAAYNTGAGNVAKAFIGNTKIGRAAKKINTLDPETVYTTLIDDLPYDETKHYLKKVTKRMSLY